MISPIFFRREIRDSRIIQKESGGLHLIDEDLEHIVQIGFRGAWNLTESPLVFRFGFSPRVDKNDTQRERCFEGNRGGVIEEEKEKFISQFVPLLILINEPPPRFGFPNPRR